MMQGYQRTPVKVGAPFFPTRLIDVGDAKNHPRLVESANYAPLTSGKVTDNRYVALSYCWGSKKEAERQLKTTKDSLRQNLRSIELGRFSEAKTLRDAVLTCRALGLRYLWIDSLCIIQQDKEDWEKESLKLSQIYKNAFLTICVLRGGSCLTGFLDRRESRPVVNMPFRSVTNPNILGIISLSPPFFSDIESTSECIQESTWNTRGWAFQEALFSPSKLLFGEDMVYYAKLARLESETGVREWQSGWASAVPSEGFDSGGWYNMLLAFTHKDFTYTTDRLPAVSSVAQSYGPAAGKGYLAGLWRSDLEHGLFWQADRGFVDIEDYLDPKKPYVAPSWSWASYPGSVWWAHPMQAGTKYNSHFTLLDANVTVPGLNPFGRPTSGHLKIFGKLHSVRGMKARPEKALLTCVFPWSFHSKGQYVANFKVDWGEAANHDDMPDDQLYDKMSMLLLSSRDLNALEMMTTNQGNPDFARPPETPEIMIGILLLPSDKRSVYTRCGIWFSQRRGIGGRAFWKDITESEVILI
ncbi:HET-domain-containing protein [Penicillium malachiteum]|nr:HET-domain-containing protein [Penicillium malachiteum]